MTASQKIRLSSLINDGTEFVFNYLWHLFIINRMRKCKRGVCEVNGDCQPPKKGKLNRMDPKSKFYMTG